MMGSQNKHRLRLPFSLVAAALAAAAPGAAWAQQPFPEENSVPGEAAVPVAPPVPAAAPLAAQPNPQAAPAAQPAGGDVGVERLPSYPDDSVRGIRGGSVWFTNHGLQWPYYPRTGIAVSGNVWLDTGYEKIDRTLEGADQHRYWLQQGRMVLRMTPTYTRGDYFVQGQAEFVANKDQSQAQPSTTDADDVWVKVGRWKSWDIQVGRFQTWEVVHLGMGLDLYTLERRGAWDTTQPTPDMYIGSFMWDRPKGPGRVAAHWYPTNALRFELAGELGTETPTNSIGVRPAAIIDLGKVKVKGAAEYKRQPAQVKGNDSDMVSRGFAGGVLILPSRFIEAGVDAAYGMVDAYDQGGRPVQPSSTTTFTTGGFLNVRPVTDLIIGGGAQLTWWENLQPDPVAGHNGRSRHVQAFGAIQYLVLNQLYIKAVFGYAKAHYEPVNSSTWDNTMLTGRVRLMYVF